MHSNFMPFEAFLAFLCGGLSVGLWAFYRMFKARERRMQTRERMFPKNYASSDDEEEYMNKMRAFLRERLMYVDDEIQPHHRDFINEQGTWDVSHNYGEYPDAIRRLFRLCNILNLRVVIVEEKDLDKLKGIIYNNLDKLEKHRWTLFCILFVSVGSVVLLTLFLCPKTKKN